MNCLKIIVALVVVFGSANGATAQDASFERLGVEGESRAIGVSADGRYMVGTLSGSNSFIWDAVLGTTEELPPLDGDNNSEARAVSNDGTIVVGRSDSGPVQAVRWENQIPMPLGWLEGGQTSYAYDVSQDGSTIVGFSDSDDNPFGEAFRWQGSMVGLGDLKGGAFFSAASAVSADGSVVVGLGTIDVDGTNRSRAFRYENGVMDPLEPLPEDDDTNAIGVSASGTFVVGTSSSIENFAITACRWGDGSIIGLEPLPDDEVSFALDVSADGAIVVGYSGDDCCATIWNAVQDTRDALQDVLENEFGLDLTGWTLGVAQAISDDGTVIVGWGYNPSGEIEAWRAVVPRDLDTDDDGLLDDWETNGLDINNDGTIDLDLPAMGADPNRKDLFVEVDVMATLTFPQAARTKVVNAFDTAPVDDSEGIKLHLQVDDGDTIPEETSWDDNFNDFADAKEDYMGTHAERTGDNWEHIKAARQRVFRYCAVVKEIDNAIGWGERPGNDFYVAFDSNYANNDYGKAALFMHELGHNLDLRHGGGDAVNYKPNYISVMNYGFLFGYKDVDGNKLPIDYSREELPTLNEGVLDEFASLQSEEYSQVRVFHGFRSGGQLQTQVGWMNLGEANYDWNHDGFLEQNVDVDLNWLGTGYSDANTHNYEALRSYNDWDIIQIPMGTDGAFAAGQYIAPGHGGITDEEIAFIQENIPPPPINVADLTDLQMVTGTILEGDMNSLVQTDQNHLRLRAAMYLNRMQLNVSATTDIEEPALLHLFIRSHADRVGVTTQVRLRNWNTGAFDLIGSYITGSEQAGQPFHNIDATNYVDQNGNVEVSMKYVAIVSHFPTFGPAFEVFIDELQITMSE